MNQPIKYHGGKYYLASWIIQHMPPHLHYVEPFFGGGSVLLARDSRRDWMSIDKDDSVPSHLRGCSEVINDINRELTNFWKVLQDTELFEQFQRRLELTPFSAIEWEESRRSVKSQCLVESAVGFFVRARQSRQGLMKCFATMSRNRTRRGMNEQVSSWLSAIDGLPEIHERLQSVVILNDDANSVICQQDGHNTFFYCDPPYLHETRNAVDAYAFEMNEEDHERLLETLSGIEGKFLLSGYRSELYDRFAYDRGWHREDRLIDNKASGRKQKEIKCECLWKNF